MWVATSADCTSSTGLILLENDKSDISYSFCRFLFLHFAFFSLSAKLPYSKAYLSIIALRISSNFTCFAAAQCLRLLLLLFGWNLHQLRVHLRYNRYSFFFLFPFLSRSLITKNQRIAVLDENILDFCLSHRISVKLLWIVDFLMQDDLLFYISKYVNMNLSIYSIDAYVLRLAVTVQITISQYKSWAHGLYNHYKGHYTIVYFRYKK